MIRYLTHELIDKQRWDECLQHAPNGLVFGNSWFLDAAYPQWAAVVKGDYEAVLALPVKRKLNILYALQPFFVRHLGIYHRTPLAPQDTASFYAHIPDTLRWVKIFTFDPGIALPRPWKQEPKHYQQLDLLRGEEALLSGFSSNTKRNIKKAEKLELSVHAVPDPQIVVDMFRQFKGAELEIFEDADYQKLLAIMKACMQHQAGHVYVAKDTHGNQLAAGFFCQFGQTLTFLKGAVTDEGRNSGAMHFLFARVIALHGNECSRLDFGGSNVESVARFYRSFGAEDQHYYLLERNTLPAWIRLFKK